MSIQTEIIGQSRGNGIVKAEMYNPRVDGRKGESSLVVYTVPRERPIAKIIPFLNDEFGNSLNQDGVFGGVPVLIADGTDTAAWTGSNLIGGKVTFDSSDNPSGWPISGTKSVKIDNPNAGDLWQFAKGSSQDLSSYISLSMDVYVDKDWTVGDSVSVFGTIAGALVGNIVLLEDYIDEFDFDVAQVASIPLADMGLTSQTIDAVRMEQVSKSGKAAKFYIDDFQIEESGGSIEFRTSHDPEARYIVNRFVITLSDVLAGTLSNGAGMIPLSYDDLLGVSTLANGITLKSVHKGEIDFSVSINSISDFMAVGFHITNALSDGTNTFVTLEQVFDDPLMIEGSPDLNFLSLSVNDDLTGLTRFSALLRGSEVFVR